MPYLNLDLDYFDHPKVRRLVGLLGRGAEVLPVRLWAYCGKFHYEDGRLTDYSPQAIETICGWWGKAGECVEVLIRVEVLEALPDGYLVHDFLEHQGHIRMLKSRAKHAARTRWDVKRCSDDASSNAQAMLKQCPIPIHSIPILQCTSEALNTEQLITAREVNGGNGHSAQCSGVQCFINDGEMPNGEKAFVELMTELGAGMENYGGLWRKRWRSEPKKCLKILGVFREDSKQKIIESPGGYMNDLWTKRLV